MKKLLKQDLITQLLEKHQVLRDDDARLICNVWAAEMKNMNIDPNQFAEIFHLFKNGYLSSPEAITRGRRKIQELEPSLRGELYYKRHKEQDVWKKELGY